MGNHYEIYRKSGKFMPIPSKTESIQTLSVKDRIYNVVCEWIITGVLKSGEKILDSELAQYFDVSRTPVREAIQMLERQKLVKVIPSRGTIVANIEIEDTEKCYRLLAEIQAFAAEEACERISEEQLLSGDTRFHEIIVKVADNEYVEDFSRILQLHISRITSFIIGINIKSRYKQSPPGSDIDHKPAGFLYCCV